MKMKNYIRKIALALVVTATMSGSVAHARTNKLFGEYKTGEILILGSSLNKEEENALKAKFKAPEGIETIYVTTETAVRQLGVPSSAIQTYKGGWYSSAYVKITSKGSGVNVVSDKLTLVTNDMLANALITSGVYNADVVASAPFNVTGESALAGILEGAEKILGESLSQEQKETAQKEIETTIEIAEEIGDKEASAIINDIKADVIKDSPINNVQIENIVVNVANNYNINLSDKSKAKIVDLMSDINELDIEYKDIKKSLNLTADKLKSDLEALGKNIKESGFFQKIFSWISDLWTSFVDAISNIGKKSDDIEQPSSEEIENTETEEDEIKLPEDIVEDTVNETEEVDDDSWKEDYYTEDKTVIGSETTDTEELEAETSDITSSDEEEINSVESDEETDINE